MQYSDVGLISLISKTDGIHFNFYSATVQKALVLFQIVHDADYIYCPALKLLGLACFIYCLNFLDTGCAFLPGKRRLLYQHSEGKKSTLLL
jgi:hypothetical protein